MPIPAATPFSWRRRACISLNVMSLVASTSTLPGIGQDVQHVGLFVQKQVAGWFYSIAALVIVLQRAPLVLRLAGVALTVFGSWRADSVSAEALCVLLPAVYAGLLPAIRKLDKPVFISASLLALPVLLLALIAWLAIPLLTPFTHRDSTFETRTLAWPEYYQYVFDHILTGLGPGIFSGSWINYLVFARNKSYYFFTYNTYLTVLGEAGFLGVCAYVVALVYLSSIRPLQKPSRYSAMSGGLALQLLLGGAIEPTIGFFPTQIALSAFLIAVGVAKSNASDCR